MKAYKKLLVMFLMGASALTISCSKDDDIAAPTLTVQQDKTSAAPGEVVKFTVNASTTETLKNLKIEETVTGSSVPGKLKDSAISSKTIVNYDFMYTVPAGATGTKEIVFTVTDNGSRSKVVKKTVTVSGTATPKSYSAKMLGAQDNGSVGSSFSTQDGTVYKVADAKTNSAKIDFLFYYGSTNFATIAAPDDAGAAQFSVFQLSTWGTRNATKFKVSNTAAFDGATTSQNLTDAYDNAGGNESSSAANLKVGDVVAFKTIGGKKGIFKVTAIDAKAAGSITLDIKVQP
jgi:hypothetical protein